MHFVPNNNNNTVIIYPPRDVTIYDDLEIKPRPTDWYDLNPNGPRPTTDPNDDTDYVENYDDYGDNYTYDYNYDYNYDYDYDDDTEYDGETCGYPLCELMESFDKKPRNPERRYINKQMSLWALIALFLSLFGGLLSGFLSRVPLGFGNYLGWFFSAVGYLFHFWGWWAYFESIFQPSE